MSQELARSPTAPRSVSADRCRAPIATLDSLDRETKTCSAQAPARVPGEAPAIRFIGSPRRLKVLLASAQSATDGSICLPCQQPSHERIARGGETAVSGNRSTRRAFRLRVQRRILKTGNLEVFALRRIELCGGRELDPTCIAPLVRGVLKSSTSSQHLAV